MNDRYEPSRDFVRRVMVSVCAYQTERWSVAGLMDRLRLVRHALVAGGALAGLFGAAPVF